MPAMQLKNGRVKIIERSGILSGEKTPLFVFAKVNPQIAGNLSDQYGTIWL